MKAAGFKYISKRGQFFQLGERVRKMARIWDQGMLTFCFSKNQ
jgi:hypothetical protein